MVYFAILLFIINPDTMKKPSSKNYNLYDDAKSSSSQPLEDTRNPFDDFRSQKTTQSNPKQVFHAYQPIDSKFQQVNFNHSQKALSPQILPTESFKTYNTVKMPNNINYGFQPQNPAIVQVLINQKPSFSQRNHIHVTIEGANYSTAMVYAQSVPCQRCGLVSNGQVCLKKGKTVWAWGTGLFLLTGLLCFIPCMIDKCRDTWVSCARCGHKKAVIKSAWCC